MTLLSAATLLLFVMDPLGNVPLFLSALRHVEPARQRRVIVRELLIALGVLVFFLFAGQLVLDLLHVSAPALTTAGGVILLLIALRMIFPTSDPRSPATDGEPFIVPLAIPYTAGPSTIATELLLMSQEPHRWPVWLAALLLAWAVSSVILYFSSGLRRVLGERGLTAMERLMGMLLITIAIEMLMSGIRDYLRG